MRDKNMSCIVPEKYEVTTYEKDGEIIIEVRLILRWICGKLGTIKEITGFGEIEEAESNIREMIRGKIIKSFQKQTKTLIRKITSQSQKQVKS